MKSTLALLALSVASLGSAAGLLAAAHAEGRAFEILGYDQHGPIIVGGGGYNRDDADVAEAYVSGAFGGGGGSVEGSAHAVSDFGELKVSAHASATSSLTGGASASSWARAAMNERLLYSPGVIWDGQPTEIKIWVDGDSERFAPDVGSALISNFVEVYDLTAGQTIERFPLLNQFHWFQSLTTYIPTEITLAGIQLHEFSIRLETSVSVSRSGTATSDISHTLRIESIKLYDINGNVATDYKSESGTVYPTPEPTSLCALGIGALAAVRYRKRA